MKCKLTFIWLIAILLIPGAAHAQSDQYLVLTKKADSLYNLKRFKESAVEFTKAFSLKNRGILEDRYTAAKAWTFAHVPDSAFVNLFKIVNLGRKIYLEKYMDSNFIALDTAFNLLHAYSDWSKLISTLSKNKLSRESFLNVPVKLVLDSVFESDQKYRIQFMEIEKNKGSEEDKKNIWSKINEADSLNIIKVSAILDKYGWLGETIVGNIGNSALFLVIQHAKLSVQEKYFPMLQEAVKSGNALPSQLALLTDRIAIFKGHKQIYGSQIAQDVKTLKYYVSPIEDIEHVNERRAKVGLGSLAEYVAQWGIILEPQLKATGIR